MNWELLIVILMAFLGIFTFFDITIFIIKSGPKQSFFSKWFLILGYISMIGLSYWFFNDKTF